MAFLFKDDKSKMTLPELLGLIYPVGAIYMSTNNVNPGTLFGGTWTQIKDRFLLAAGTTYAAGATGGEAKHKLEIAELPSHKHSMNKSRYSYYHGATQSASDAKEAVMTDNYDTANLNETWATGKNTAHNNMPPYVAVYVWKRTA